MGNKEAKELLIKYKVGICTDEELAMLESWYLDYKDGALTDLSAESLNETRAQVWKNLPVHNSVKRTVRLWPRIAVAASITIAVAIGLIFFQQRKSVDLRIEEQTAAIVPGGNKAILTLADGSKIALDDAANGTLASQSGIVITKNKNGQIIYSVDKKVAGSATLYNTVETPRGGQYQVDLPDGTKVWLNAASSLKFPTAFEGSERRVELNGEGYFEVAHNKSMPFKVVSNLQVVQVLGTHFNINAYFDENQIKTTLVEGRVSVAIGAKSIILKPGQQAAANKSSIEVKSVNTEDAIAWKENTFVFNNEELGSIMRKISRWYDVDVICPVEAEKMIFSGVFSRNKSIKQILSHMESTGTIHFKIEGRRITVKP